MRTSVSLILLLVMALSPISSARAEALATWDGLPAFDPLHLAGAYAGRRVCPMCTHGYDAGLVLFVPTTLGVAEAAALIAPLRRLRDDMSSPRYRVFVILTGAAPSPGLLDAVSVAHAQWYVAELSGAELSHAERDFGATLSAAPLAYAFAQRRLLRQYSASGLLDPSTSVAADARYAMDLLGWLYPEARAADADHDTPQGALWFAPTRLRANLELAAAAAAAACFLDDAGNPQAYALLFLQSADDAQARPGWDRTDAHGCLQLAAAPGRYRATLYPLGQAPRQHELLRADVRDAPPVLDQCDGCEAVYDQRPLHLISHARIAPQSEPGERLRLRGKVYAADGSVAAGIQIYAYQTDQNGIYPPLVGVSEAARRHGRLRAWAISDSHGEYRFETVRPGGYPATRLPQHIHLQVIEAGRCTYYLDDVVFADDPRRSGQPEGASPRGGTGLTHPDRSADGVWDVRRDIHLGRNLPAYEQCAAGVATGRRRASA